MFIQTYLVIVFSSLVVVIGTIIDGILTSRFLGEASISALGLCTPILLIVVAISGVFSAGGQINTAQHLGKGALDKAKECFSLVFFMAVIFSLIISVLIYVFSGAVAEFLHAGDPGTQLFHETSQYLKGFAIGLPATILSLVLMPFVQMDGNKRRVITALLCMIVINVSGDYLNVYVFHGGMFGMGLATSVSAIASAAVLVSYFFTANSNLRVVTKNIPWKCAGMLFVTGAPTAMQRVYSATANLLLNYIVKYYGGETALAAHSAKGNVVGLLLVLGASCGPAVMQTVSVLYGEEDKEGVKHILHIAIALALSVTSVVVLVTVFMPSLIAGIYMKADEPAFPMLVDALRLYAFVFPFSALCDSLAGYFQASKETLSAHAIPFLEYLALPVAFAFVLGRTSLGMNGVWMSFVIAEILTLILVWTGKCIIRRRLITDPSDMISFPEGFDNENERYTKEIMTVEDAVYASDEIIMMGKKILPDDMRVVKMALAVEEMGKNIVTYGFDKDNDRKHKAELRVMLKKDKIILRMRDNCQRFDCVKYYTDMMSKGNGSSDKYGQFGIKMIHHLADSIQYLNTFGMNNILITI